MFGNKAKHIVNAKGSKKTVPNRKKGIESELHPSWEASKRKKELESRLVPFQGQKTIFSD